MTCDNEGLRRLNLHDAWALMGWRSRLCIMVVREPYFSALIHLKKAKTVALA